MVFYGSLLYEFQRNLPPVQSKKRNFCDFVPGSFVRSFLSATTETDNQ